MNLSEIYAEFVDNKDEKERDPHRLFVTDVGRCPRKTAYRLLGTKKAERSAQQRYNQQILWDLAEHMERVLSAALDEKGLLLAYQDDVDISPRENWGGRLDIVADYFGTRVIEVKTLHPNAFRYEIDYPAHQLQAGVYHVYSRIKYELLKPPMLVYFDRGGSNTAVEQTVGVDSTYIAKLMDELEDVRDNVISDKMLPERVSKELRIRSSGKRIVLEPSGDCNYCEYFHECLPDMGKEVWANRENADVPWVATKKADKERLLKFADTMVTRAMEGE